MHDKDVREEKSLRYAGSPQGIKVQVVHRADEEYPFLHDTMVVPLLGKLFMAWYNCSEAEIVGKTVIRGCWSQNGGRSWSEPEIVAEDISEQIHYVPVTFQERNGEAYAYITRMEGHDRPVGYECRKYREGKWIEIKSYEDPLLFNTLVMPFRENHLIAGGRMAAERGELPLIPVVMISENIAPAEWQIKSLPGPWKKGEYPFPYPETALITEHNRITAIIRGEEDTLYCYSVDGGKSWKGPMPFQIQAEGSKMYGGVLKNGKKYFVFNQRTERRDRSRLVMAVGEEYFDRLYVLRDGYDEGLDAGPFWHYPCVCECGDILCISCTSSSKEPNVRHGILIQIPIDSI
ncbi:MAG: exo-alpha-sialidase [Eubacteriales bacterium]|nr:exo-alpha-sialidase [Eubacteriales bacterium]